MKEEYESAQKSLSEAEDKLSVLLKLEEEMVTELEGQKQKYLDILPAAETDDSNWRSLNSTFTDDDLKGLIFIAQRKLENVARELRDLKKTQDEEVQSALAVRT